jgi:hypothetical protein
MNWECDCFILDTKPCMLSISEIIWSILQVDEGGVLGVTQQMSRIGSEFNIPNSPPKPMNPFGQMNSSFDEMGTSPIGSPNYSILAQHGSPDTSLRLHNSSLHNVSFSTSSPIRTSLFQVSRKKIIVYLG